MSYTNKEEGRTLSETIPSNTTVEEEYENLESQIVLERAFSSLSWDEMYAVATSFGVMNQPKKNLKAVAAELGVSVGTVSKRKRDGIRKLRDRKSHV